MGDKHRRAVELLNILREWCIYLLEIARNFKRSNSLSIMHVTDCQMTKSGLEFGSSRFENVESFSQKTRNSHFVEQKTSSVSLLSLNILLDDKVVV